MCNHCCSRTAVSVRYYECEFVAFLIHHAMCMRRIILSSVFCPAVPYFPHYVINAKIFEKKKLLKTKYIRQIVDYRNVNHPKRQISEPTFSSFYVQTTKNQRLLHAIKYCVISIKYCILYVLYCIIMVTLS